MCHPEIKAQLLNDVEDLLKRCRGMHNSTMDDALSDPVKACQPETELSPEDSISQIECCQDAASTMSNKLLARQFDLHCRRAALRPICVRDLARAETKANAAAAAETDAVARLQIGEAKLEDKEKYIALYESASSVGVSRRYKHKLRFSSVVASGVHRNMDTRRTDLNEKCAKFDFCESELSSGLLGSD